MPLKNTPHLYAITACESSGDLLGASLMRAILQRDPNAKFIGIGGPKMIALGMKSAHNIDDLSVMGFFEVFKNLAKILKIRKSITNTIIAARPIVYIGIDGPDFNLYVERKVKENHIPTVQYVSPSVWAWREGRLNKIKQSCDLILALLPFEKEYYDKVNMPCTYVGHNLVNMIPLEYSQDDVRARLELYKHSVEPVLDKVMAIMPGSRKGELANMIPIFARAARKVKQKIPSICFISAAPSYQKALLIKDLWLANAPDLSLTIFVGKSHEVLASSDAVLLTCGTVALEAMLWKKPMAVAYKVNAITALILKRLLKIKNYSLPNLLAKREVVAEFIQDKCNPDLLAKQMLSLLSSDNLLMKKEFATLHSLLQINTDEIATKAIFDLISKYEIKDSQEANGEQTENLNTDNSRI